MSQLSRQFAEALRLWRALRRQCPAALTLVLVFVAAFGAFRQMAGSIEIGRDCFVPHPLQLITDYHLIIQRYTYSHSCWQRYTANKCINDASRHAEGLWRFCVAPHAKQWVTSLCVWWQHGIKPFWYHVRHVVGWACVIVLFLSQWIAAGSMAALGKKWPH